VSASITLVLFPSPTERLERIIQEVRRIPELLAHQGRPRDSPRHGCDNVQSNFSPRPPKHRRLLLEIGIGRSQVALQSMRLQAGPFPRALDNRVRHAQAVAQPARRPVGRAVRRWLAGYIVLLQRGTEWAATGSVTIPVPGDFPTPERTSIR
jgi:hypothetical protein